MAAPVKDERWPGANSADESPAGVAAMDVVSDHVARSEVDETTAARDGADASSNNDDNNNNVDATGTTAGDGDDADDEVVCEFDVFLSQQHAASMAVLQFPLRPRDRPYAVGDVGDKGHSITRARYKPQQMRVELGVALDTDSTRYSRDSEYAPRHAEHVLTGQAQPQRTASAVVLVRGRELHVAPVRAVSQLRPSFEHVDVSRQAQAEANSTGDGQANLVPMADAPGSLQQARVQVKKRESERAIAARERSHQYQQQLEDGEDWLEFEPVPRDSEATEQLIEQLVCGNDMRDQRHCTQGKSDFWRAIVDAPEPGSTAIDSAVSPGVSAHRPHDKLNPSVMARIERLRLPLPVQVITLLEQAIVISFDDVQSRVQQDGAPALASDILAILESHAVLVQGRWVLDSASPSLPYHGRHRVRMARDYLLYQFSKHHSVVRSDVSAYVRIDEDTLLQLLRQFAVPSSDPALRGRWFWRHGRDERFIRHNHQHVAAAMSRWDVVFPRLSDYFENDSAAATVGPDDPLQRVIKAEPMQHQTQLLQPSSMERVVAPMLDFEMNDEAFYACGSRESQIEYLVLQRLHQYGVVSLTHLHAVLRAQAQDADPRNLVGDVKDADILGVLAAHCVQLQHAFCLRTVPGLAHPQLYDLLISLFSASPVLKKADIKREFEQRFSPQQLPSSFAKTIKILATSQGSGWRLKSGEVI